MTEDTTPNNDSSDAAQPEEQVIFDSQFQTLSDEFGQKLIDLKMCGLIIAIDPESLEGDLSELKPYLFSNVDFLNTGTLIASVLRGIKQDVASRLSVDPNGQN